jgi:hypothetical protein
MQARALEAARQEATRQLEAADKAVRDVQLVSACCCRVTHVALLMPQQAVVPGG